MAKITENTYPTLDQATKAAAADMAEALKAALKERDKVSLALSGGRTPRLVLPLLAQADVEWPRVVATLTDERCVATDHPDSNEGMVRSCFLQGPAAECGFVGLYDPQSPSPAANAVAATARFRTRVVPFPLDVVFLGMGADGHIASLFSRNHPSTKAGNLCVAAHADNHPHWRVSMTVPMIGNARRYHLIVNGAAKREAYVKAMGGDDYREYPVRLVLKQDKAPVFVYFCEE